MPRLRDVPFRVLPSAPMKTAELDYALPERLIAQHPLEQRDASRMLVVDRGADTFHEAPFARISEFLNPGDCLVLNTTRVIRARLKGYKATGGAVEIFLLRELSPGAWEALVRPSAKVKPGTSIALKSGMTCVVGEVISEGRRCVTFETPDVMPVLEAAGEVPLPPYIHRKESDPSDLTRYQTVYAQTPGAVAAPTAGLHYTEDILQSLSDKGIDSALLTLHVGYGTFQPVTVDTLEEHRVAPEDFEFPEVTAQKLNATRSNGGRVVAVGTTSTRVLETQWREGAFHAGAGETATYIYPPYDFVGVDVLQTNFHLPKSSLLSLVAAFAGTEIIMQAYRYAVKQKFRFYSYGDVMLIL